MEEIHSCEQKAKGPAELSTESHAKKESPDSEFKLLLLPRGRWQWRLASGRCRRPDLLRFQKRFFDCQLNWGVYIICVILNLVRDGSPQQRWLSSKEREVRDFRRVHTRPSPPHPHGGVIPVVYPL